MTEVARGRNSERIGRCRQGSDMHQYPYMRGSGPGPEQLKDLYDSIERYHLEFLSLEGDRKVESLRLLKAYAAEFLSQVSHPQKFKFAATDAVLSHSIAVIHAFDPREASVAYEDLAKYANNLLEQPWRKEFYRLRTTSGFFIHNIRAKLTNPQEILILLGYVGTDDYTMELAFAPDPATLAAVSRDCYIASQECLILSQILDRVRTELPEYPLTIQEVYAARKLLIGDTSATVKHLIHQIRIQCNEPRETISTDTRPHHRRRSESQPYFEPQAVNHSHHTFPAIDHFVSVPDGEHGLQISPSAKLYSNVKSNGSKVNSKQISSISNNIQNHAQSETSTSGSNRHSSNSTSRSSSSPRSPNSCNSLKELEDVFIQTYLESKVQGPRHSDSGSEVSDLLEKHHHNVNQIEALRQQRSSQNSQSKQSRGRRSDLGQHIMRPTITDGTRLESDALYDVVDGRRVIPSRSHRSSMPSTSGFKGLKHHQDLPKSSSNLSVASSTGASSGTLNNGLLGKIKVSLGGKNSKQEKTDSVTEKDSNGIGSKGNALTKSKVPHDYDLDKVDVRGSGILDRSGKGISVPPLGNSSSDERIYHNEENRSSPVPIHNHITSDNSQTEQSSLSSPELAANHVKWRCPHCTYDNASTAKICEMCSKSKDFVLEESESWEG